MGNHSVCECVCVFSVCACACVCVQKEMRWKGFHFCNFFNLKTKICFLWWSGTRQYNNLIALGVKLNFPLLIRLSELI